MSRHRLRCLTLGYVFATAMMWLMLGYVTHYLDDAPVHRTFTQRDVHAEVAQFARARGINRSNYQSMSAADRQQLQQILMHRAITSGPGIIWIASGASIAVFAVLGLGIGCIRRAWPLAGVLPFLSLALNNPLSGYSLQQIDPANKMLLFAGQCAACYIFAYLTAPRRHRI